MTIRQPRLLDENRHELLRLSPVKLTIRQRLFPLSTAEMILPWDAPSTAPRALVELFDPNGSAGVFRVKAVEETLRRTRSVTLEHGLCTLRDSVIPAQGFTDSVRGALVRLLACQHQPLWAVGEVEVPEDLTVIFATDYVDLLSAVESLLDMLPEGYALDFDQSRTPWLLHLRSLSNAPFCEGRMSRNLQSVRVKSDASTLCTRVYPFGAETDTGRITLVPLTGSDHLDADSLDALGVISRTFDSDLIFDVPTLRDVAQTYLDRHASPVTTITVSAADLSAATGEAIDHFRPGRLCRLCLPEEGLVLEERITEVEQPDVFSAPGQVKLTLSNRLKQQSESREIDEMVRQVTTRKLLGGTVSEIEQTNRAYGAFNSPVVHYFDIEDWGALLDVRVTFQTDANATMRDVRVDDTYPDDDVWKSGSFSAMPYLRHDELGQIARGQHKVVFSPYGSSVSDSCGVSSQITLTVIEKTTT